MANWAELDDVLDVTGREATPEGLALAHAIIEILANASTTASDEGLISGRNLELLRKAVCFQAVWNDAHPDVLDVMDVQGINQDGLSAQYASAHAHLLAPLAARCVRRLSWMKAEIRTRSRRRLINDTGNRDSAVRDDQFQWTPM